MNLLWLGNSEDVLDETPEELRSFRIAARIFEERTGAHLDITVRPIWPSEKLPGLVDGWLDRYSPDIVMFRVNAFWYLYRSVPLQLERKFGRAAGPLEGAGKRMAANPWIGRTAAFHFARRQLLRVFGGATHFTAAEVIVLAEDISRRIVQREQVGLVIHPTLDRWYSNPRPQRFVHRRLRAFAASIHVQYLGLDPVEGEGPPEDFYASGDRLHSNDAGNRWQAEKQAEALIAAWTSLREPARMASAAQ